MYDITTQKRSFMGNFFERLSDNIDLTKTQQETAVARYEVVGKWLASEESPLAKFNPRILPQGSFRTGTTVRPANDECEFDVDLTCILEGSLPAIQKALKELVGARLNKHCERYELKITEHRRCWRIHYKETSGFSFHLDIVPAMQDQYEWVTAQNVSKRYAEHAIVITDVKHADYERASMRLPQSNTEGYSRWFIDMMKYNADKIDRTFSKGIVNLLKEHVEEMPYFKERTPLQRAIQLMKRHRDIKFGDHDDKPVSIIISTLAAHAYREAMDALEPQSFYDVLVRIVELMPTYIARRGNVSWVPNPVNPLENFADKWQEKPAKEKIFREWLAEFRAGLEANDLNEGMQSIPKLFSKAYGEKTVNSALSDMGDTTRMSRDSGTLKMASTGIIGSTGLAVTKHLFHGKKG